MTTLTSLKHSDYLPDKSEKELQLDQAEFNNEDDAEFHMYGVQVSCRFWVCDSGLMVVQLQMCVVSLLLIDFVQRVLWFLEPSRHSKD